jgi:serine/threonine-protein phosphatase 2B catalytic subunit
MLIRAHEVQMEGYKFNAFSETSSNKLCLTLFSAPNYCEVYNNRGALLKIDPFGSLKLETFAQSKDSPYFLPDKEDLFEFGIDYLTSQILDVFTHCLLNLDRS